MFFEYYRLVKPERTYANAMTALAGFLLAAQGHVRWGLLVATLVGTSLIVAAACAFNNIYDRDIDSLMERTNKRALVRGNIPARHATLFACALGMAGFAILALYVNLPTVIAGVVGMVDYLLFYGPAKRRTVYSTLIGSICGATPIAAGYLAVADKFTIGTLLVFLIMVFWQMPHFYAIAVYRVKDYAAANLPVWPVKKGLAATKVQIIFYLVLYIAACLALWASGYASTTFAAAMGALGLWWLWLGAKGFKTGNSTKWARQLFTFSLWVLVAQSILMSINAYAP